MAYSPPKKNKSPQPMHTTKDTHPTRALLTHVWLFLGKWLGRLLLLSLTVGLDGWVVGSLYYAWKFSGPVFMEEQIVPGETRIIQAVVQDAIRVVKQYRDNTRVLRDIRAKTHGCVEAEFRVRADLDPTLRRGVLVKMDKSQDAWMRFSNGNAYSQFNSKDNARGMAIKLFDVPDEKLLPGRGHDGEQDFVMFNQPVSFIRDIAGYQQSFTTQADGKKTLAFFPNWNPTSWELCHLLIALRTLVPAPDNPLHTSYDGISLYKLGEHSIKFRVVPTSEKCPVYQLPRQSQDLSNFLRAALYQQLSIDRTPACYAFQVQCRDPGKYIPIEDTSVEWKESGTPFATIADTIAPAQDLDSREQNLFRDNLSFNPWHALPKHRPIGGINRLRKTVHEAASGYRLGRNK